MAALDPETASSRFDRYWGEIVDDRRVRGLDNQSLERAQRLFVEADGSTLADDDNVNL